jgi:hypothetical protein
LKVNLVTTTANKNLEELKEYCKDKKWIKLYVNSNEVAKLMINSDFAIVTPSVIANEIFYLNLSIIVLDNTIIIIISNRDVIAYNGAGIVPIISIKEIPNKPIVDITKQVWKNLLNILLV